MTHKFTPGPWSTRIIRESVSVFADDQWCVAFMFETHEIRTREIALANGRLIAAAPDLYAALLECHQAMEYMSEYDIPIGLPERVQDALVKAGYTENDDD